VRIILITAFKLYNARSRNRQYCQLYIWPITSAWRWLEYIEPKHVAGSNNVKYIINPNNNY